MLGFLCESTRKQSAYSRSAERINPNDAHIIAMSSQLYSYLGDHVESRKLLERAFALNPYPPSWYWEHRAARSLRHVDTKH